MKKVNSTMGQFERESILSKLIFLGKTSNTVEIQGFSFEIETLSEKMSREVLSEILMLPEQQRLAYIKGITLSKSISKINNVSFDEMVIEKLNFENKEVTDLNLSMAKSEVVNSLQISVTNKLYEAYEKLTEDMNKGAKGDEIKN